MAVTLRLSVGYCQQASLHAHYKTIEASGCVRNQARSPLEPMRSRNCHSVASKTNWQSSSRIALERLPRPRFDGAVRTGYAMRLQAAQAAAIATFFLTLAFLPVGATAQTPSTAPPEFVEKAAQTQKIKAEIEGKMRELRRQLDAEMHKLKAWTAVNMVGRAVAWLMTTDSVEMGYFSHDIIAESSVPEIQLRCQLTATDENKQLQSRYPRGTTFTCAGRLSDVVHFSDRAVITVQQAKATTDNLAPAIAANKPTIEPTLNTKKISAEHARKAIELFQAACAPLFTTHAADIVEVKAMVHDGWSPRAESWGWGVEIWIEVVLRERTQTFSDARAGGHHLWYFLGGGAKSGFQAQKRISQAACGLPVRDEQPDAFVPVPGLSAFLPPAS